jgi:DNA-binding Lrp family transcriptional regulator
MDDTDRKLMLLIYADPRMPIQELAKGLGISSQAVSHRMQVLTKLGVFKDVRAAISFHYLGAVNVYIWGRSEGKSVEKMLDRFSENELTVAVIVLGGNDLLIVGALRDASELGSYVEFVKREAEMPQATIVETGTQVIILSGHHCTELSSVLAFLARVSFLIVLSLGNETLLVPFDHFVSLLDRRSIQCWHIMFLQQS